MFPRNKRVKRKDFSSALRRGISISSPHFRAVFPKEKKGYAVIVSKKTAKSSVERHTIKRKVLAALHPLSLPPSLILFPLTQAGSLTTEEIQAEISGILAKNKQ